jgi:hypothetical protein
MNRQTKLMIVIAIGIILVSCGTATKEIARMSQSEKTGVFTEATAEGPIPAGSADVLIKASIKTPPERYYALESKESAHGKPGYTFLVNIDGQAALWKAEGRKHDLPKYIDGKTSRDPEAGEGMKYVLEKRIRIAPGAHRVFFGVPGEAYYTSTDITVMSGVLYVLEFKPVYRYKTLPTRIPTFLKGISNYRIFFQKESADKSFSIVSVGRSW